MSIFRCIKYSLVEKKSSLVKKEEKKRKMKVNKFLTTHNHISREIFNSIYLAFSALLRRETVHDACEIIASLVTADPFHNRAYNASVRLH